MSLCAYCGQETIGSSGLCSYHNVGHSDDWARENRMMCDFIHRGIVVPVPLEDVLLEAA